MKRKVDLKYNTQSIEQSGFYNLYDIDYLCKLLKVKNKEELNCVLNTKNKNLIKSNKEDKKGKKRDYTYPKPNSKLALVYEQILVLFDRIKKPDYLFSCKKGTSHVYVAKYHSNCTSLVTIDIDSFFPSVKAKHVFNFFKNTMKCTKEISTILSQLLTHNNQLMQGACFSPVLSWLSFKDMFDKINQEAQEKNLKFSLWIDDIAISGAGSHKFIENIQHYFNENDLKIKWKKLNKYKHLTEIKEIMGVLIESNKIYTKVNANAGYKKYVNRVNSERL